MSQQLRFSRSMKWLLTKLFSAVPSLVSRD